VFVLIFTAVVIYPIMSRLSGVATDINQGSEYVLRNAFLPINLKWDIAGAPLGVPHPGSINGSLWTHPLEVRAYAIAGFLALIFRSPSSRLLVFPITASVFFAISLLKSFGVGGFWNPLAAGSQAELLAIFFTAGTYALYHERMFLRRHSFVLALTLLTISAVFLDLPFQKELLSIVVFFLMLEISKMRIWERMSWFDNDYSYGLYIWAFPIQQLLIMSVPGIAHVEYLIAGTFVTFVFAAVSWHLIEKPCMGLRVKLVRSQSL
jgi:peptidoglycan/LPS O-acetylase OafA/YrhL